jgi:hypothetical protein
MGWLIWSAMRVLAAFGFLLFGTAFVLFIWFMFEVGFAWAAIVVIGLVLLLLFFAVKNIGSGYDIRR